MKTIKGQSLLEFAVILSVIVVFAVGALTILGGNVKDTYNNTKTKYEGFKPFDYMTGDASRATGSSGEKVPDSLDITDVNISSNDDGSVTMNVANQNITLPTSVLDNMNTVFETSGSDGMNDHVVSAIKQLVMEHKDDYPGDVPLDIKFGASQRNITGATSSISYSGVAEFNQVTLSVDDHYVILVKDQNIDGKEVIDDDERGIYKIDGRNNEVEGFRGTVSALDTNNATNTLDGIPISGNAKAGGFELSGKNSTNSMFDWSLQINQ